MSDVLQELSAVVAALSSDVEEVIRNGVTTELLAQAEATFNTDLQERMQDAVLPLFADGEDGSTALSWAEKVTQAAMPAVTFEAIEALRELAGKAIHVFRVRLCRDYARNQGSGPNRRHCGRVQSDSVYLLTRL